MEDVERQQSAFSQVQRYNVSLDLFFCPSIQLPMRFPWLGLGPVLGMTFAASGADVARDTLLASFYQYSM
jgi:hypothetical protein